MPAALTLQRTKHLLPLLKFLEDGGVSAGPILSRARLPESCRDIPGLLIPVPCAGEFRHQAARETGDALVVVAALEGMTISNLGGFGQSILASPTVASALATLVRLSGTETSNLNLALQHTRGAGSWFMVRSSKVYSGIYEIHTILHTVAIVLKIIRLSGENWSPQRFYTHLDELPWVEDGIKSICSNAIFGHSSTGFFIPESILAAPIAAAMPSMNTDSEIASIPRSNSDNLKTLLSQYPLTAPLSITQASVITGMSVRSLQRMLSLEHTCYSALIDELRSARAMDLLSSSDLKIGDIANELGYKNQGDFTRAFYRWASVSPRAYRAHRHLR